MNYLFFIQGEGRGHLTQALTLKEKLESHQHQVVAAIVSSHQELPDYFKKQLTCPIFVISGPKFVVDKNNQGINIFKSIGVAIQELPLYWQSIKKIKKTVADYNPDVLINFYEPLGNVYHGLYQDKRPMVCLGHQYFISHPDSHFPKMNYFSKLAFYFYNWLSSWSSDFKIALSFTNSADLPERKLYICPPFIRAAIKNQPISRDHFILVYLLNAGYSAEIITWCQKNPKSKVEAFWNKPGAESVSLENNLIFHPLSGQKFIDRLAACQIYVSTAGFESIAEAAYLQKTIIMIPTKNHFEQKYNAADARRAGLASSSTEFQPPSLNSDQQKTPSLDAAGKFKEWVDNYDYKIIDLLEKKLKK